VHLLRNALICASTVLECSCCRIRRYVAAPQKLLDNKIFPNYTVLSTFQHKKTLTGTWQTMERCLFWKTEDKVVFDDIRLSFCF
jgi:hypothetical protein